MRVLLDYASPPPPAPPHLPLCFSCCYGFFKVTTTSHDSRVKTPPGMPLDRVQGKKKKREKQLSDVAVASSLLLLMLLILLLLSWLFSPPPPLSPWWWLFSWTGPIQSRSSSCILPSSVLSVSSSVFAFSTSLRSYVVTTPHCRPPLPPAPQPNINEQVLQNQPLTR